MQLLVICGSHFTSTAENLARTAEQANEHQPLKWSESFLDSSFAPAQKCRSGPFRRLIFPLVEQVAERHLKGAGIFL